MGFSTVDQLVNAATVNGTMQRLPFSKLLPSTTAANIPHTMWFATGIPAVGTSGSNGPSNGRTLTDASTGGYPYGNAASGTNHLISLGGTCVTASGTGSLVLVDRITDCLLNHAQATSAVTGVDASSRLAATTAPGDGGQIWCEVVSAFSAASNTITYQVTDQLGNTAQTIDGMVTTASAIVGRSTNALLWQKLTTAITGARAVTNLTLTSGTATGTYNLCVVRPLGVIPLPTVSVYVERDFVVEIPNLPKLFDDSCLAFILIPTAAATHSIFGELRMCYN